MQCGRNLWWGLVGLMGLMVGAGGPLLAQDDLTPLPLPGPDAPPVVVWRAEQSLPGGPLADARLEQPVRFWQAGLSMLEVFTSCRTQTGVDLEYWPPQTAERPARVNLYLNPDAPPTLREVLAQLAWVLDCSVASTQTEPRHYYLVDRSPSPEAVEARLEEARAKGEADDRRAKEQGEARLRARLQQCRAALALSRKDAITRYRGVDDRLLLALLVPTRRAGLQFLVSLSSQEVAYLFGHRVLDRKWTELTAPQRKYLLAALQLPNGATPYRIRLGALPKQFAFWGQAETEEEETLGDVGLPEVDEPLWAAERVELRRALGEKVSSQEARRLETLEDQEVSAQGDRQRAKWRERLLREPALTDAARTKLLGARLAWRPDAQYALWQLQEAVAVRTGLHVISDCFRQRPWQVYGFEGLDPEFTAVMQATQQKHEDLVKRYPQLEEDSDPFEGDSGPEGLPEAARQELADLRAAAAGPYEIPLFYWLARACQDRAAEAPLLPGEYGEESAKEWGNDGPFLRFRTTYRQLYRAAMLPETVLAQLQAMGSPPLERTDFSGPTPELSYRIELAQAVHLVPLATRLQWRMGPGLIYEDPATALGAARARVRDAVGITLSDHLPLLQLLGTLSPEQWQKLTAGGLRCEEDLTPSQRTSPAVKFALAMARSREGPKASLARLGLVAWDGWQEGHVTDVDFTYDRGNMEGGLSLRGRPAPAPTPPAHLVTVPEGRGSR